jgi:hypothetical protein
LRILLLAALLSACSCAAEPPPTASDATGVSSLQLDTLPAVLACAQAALGGAAALDAVSSILVKVETRSADSTAITGTSQLAMEWPDRFLSVRAQPSLPETAWGVTGARAISAAMVNGKWEVHTTAGTSLSNSRQEFARLGLAWLLRTSTLVPLTLSLAGREPALPGQVIISAAGPEGFDARLTIDDQTCLPSSLTFSRPPNLADEMRSKGQGLPVTMFEGLELTNYQPAGTIRFPMTMTRVLNGRRTGVWRVTDVAINPALNDFFELR